MIRSTATPRIIAFEQVASVCTSPDPSCSVAHLTTLRLLCFVVRLRSMFVSQCVRCICLRMAWPSSQHDADRETVLQAYRDPRYSIRAAVCSGVAELRPSVPCIVLHGSSERSKHDRYFFPSCCVSTKIPKAWSKHRQILSRCFSCLHFATEHCNMHTTTT
jgi:hypothetical protein